MNLAVSIGFIMVIGTGLGGWLPGAGLGARTFVGLTIMPMILFIANAVFSIPLSITVWIVVAIAVLGLLNLAFERRSLLIRHPKLELTSFVFHPVVVLTALCGSLAIAGGVDRYEPINWDELSNWLHVTRQMFVADVVWRKDMSFSNPGYMPGWYLAMLFPNLPFGEFREVRTLAAGVAGTISFCGLIYDVFSRHIAFPANGNRVNTAVGAWLGTAVILIVTAQPLVPKNTLIEVFQVQLTAAPFLLALLWRPHHARSWVVVLAAGLCFAAGYSLKAAGLVTLSAIPLVVFFLSREDASLECRDWRRVLVHFAYLSIPFISVFILWKIFGTPAEGRCTADPFETLQRPWEIAKSSPVFNQFIDLSARYTLNRILSLEGLLGVAGIILALYSRKWRPLACGLLFFLFAYYAALLWIYLTCLSNMLVSFKRYEGIALDVVFICGGVFVIIFAVRKELAALGGRRGRAIRSVAAGCTLLLIGYGVQTTLRGLPLLSAPFGDGHPFQPAFVEKRLPILLGKDNLKTIASTTQSAGKVPRVSIVIQGSDGFEKVLLSYHGLNGKRGQELKIFDVAAKFSWDPGEGNIWSTKATPEEIRIELLASDIIWPRKVDGFIGQVLVNFVDSPVCGNYIRWNFLWRPSPGNHYRCVPIEGLIRYIISQEQKTSR